MKLAVNRGIAVGLSAIEAASHEAMAYSLAQPAESEIPKKVKMPKSGQIDASAQCIISSRLIWNEIAREEQAPPGVDTHATLQFAYKRDPFEVCKSSPSNNVFLKATDPERMQLFTNSQMKMATKTRMYSNFYWHLRHHAKLNSSCLNSPATYKFRKESVASRNSRSARHRSSLARCGKFH